MDVQRLPEDTTHAHPLTTLQRWKTHRDKRVYWNQPGCSTYGDGNGGLYDDELNGRMVQAIEAGFPLRW